MEHTLAKKIVSKRKEKGWTQEELAELVGVSPQAVSKWENAQSCPDIQLLPKLAELFEISVDELLSHEPPQPAIIVPEEQRKSIDAMMLKIIIDSHRGDRVRVNLPMTLVKMGLEMGMSMPQISGSNALNQIDLAKILELAERGLIGNLTEIESAEGDTVRIVVE